MSKLFNRKDATVIEYGLNHTEEEFAKNYSDTTANAETLKKAYKEINGNKTKSKIAVASGDGDPSEPLKPVYAQNEQGNIEKVDEEISYPAPKGQKAWSKSGTVTIVKKAKTTETEKPAVKAVSKTKAKPTAKPKAEKPAVSGDKPTGSKRDAIKALLTADPTMTNREVKDAILAQGYPSIYDSEISNCKK